MSTWTQIWLVYNSLHAIFFVTLFMAYFWILGKFSLEERLKHSLWYYFLFRIICEAIINLQAQF